MIFLIVASVIIFLFGFVVFFGAPYVPSHHAETKAAFDELYPLTKRDTLVDIGSGDGIILRLAAAKGARAIGYELNPILTALSWLLCRRYDKISVKTANFWQQAFPNKTTIIYIFSVSRDGKRLVKKMQQEANRLQRPLSVMVYGSRLPGLKPTGQRRAHFLYVFDPLQPEEA